jgi:hypothetical protein
MRSFFDQQVSAGKANIGRWVDDIPPERRSAFEAHHRALVERLQAAGRPVGVT